MYLLYLDESGNENDPSNRFFVLAGLALQALGERVSAPWNPVGFDQQPCRHSVFRPNEGITIAPGSRLHRTRNLALV